jgi:hypothetical protein
MSIASEITRLQNDSAAIAAAIAAKGVTVPSGSGMDDYAGLIAQIQTKYINVVPTSMDLTDNFTAGLTVVTNSAWNILSIPSGLTASVQSGTGNTSVTITRSTFTGTGTIVFETSDHALTSSVTVTHQGSTPTELTMTSVGGDLENMGFPLISGIYYIELDFNPEDEGFVMLNPPNWIHFDDQDAESGIVYYPGVYGLYCEELPTSSPREGYIDAQGVGTGTDVSLHVRQIE